VIITCEACQAKYNIDETKIPPQGVRAKCTKCGGVLIIKRPEPVVAPPPVVEPKPVVPEPKPPVSEPKIDVPVSKPGEPEEEPPVMAGLTEEDRRWHERARRLAKVLASDLVLYHKDKVEQGLREGTLAKLLGTEIRRSWEYYCQQIPKQVVESTNYFKEALNRIVGKGREIFR
jgi:predicted Zn finger-like uncharacterized protein